MDPGDCGAIRMYRAMCDPIIVHDTEPEEVFPRDHPIYNQIPLSRIDSMADTPPGERIKAGTWPEVVMYLSSVAVTEPDPDVELAEIYHHAVRETAKARTEMDMDKQRYPINLNPDLNSRKEDVLEDLFHALKKDRDLLFVTQEYETFEPEEPRSFWLGEGEIPEQPDVQNYFSREAVDIYL